MKLDEVGSVGRGKSKHRPRNDPSLYGGHYPFIQTGDVKGADLWLTQFTQTYNDKGLAQSKLWPIGTLCITIAANIAETAILKVPACFPDSIVGFRPHPGKADARFIKYCIDTLKVRMKNAAKGTTQDNLSVDKLTSFDFALPEFTVQERIASILSAYDDLIENNTRRIKILEEMAQMIYREWFVNFRFPGHENVKMVESELGPIPEGWRVVGFDEISKILSGGTPKTTEPEYWNGPIPFFGPTDAPDSFYVVGTTKSITEVGLSKCNSKLYPAETVIITARGTVGKVALAASSMAMNQSCYALQGKPGVNQLALFLTTKDCARQLKQKSHGAVFETITIETFEKLRVVRPPDFLLEQLQSKVRPKFDCVLNLLRRNVNLRTTRDFLLPKLISGEVSVEAAEEALLETVG